MRPLLMAALVAASRLPVAQNPRTPSGDRDGSSRRRYAFAVLLLLAGLWGCSDVTIAREAEREGDDPGECADDADNDGDGLFDCADPDCAGAEACAGDDDDSGDDDDDSALDPLDSDDDGDGFTENQGDCDDADPANFPGNVEACDGQDNDCNGMADAVGGEDDVDGDGVLACADCDDSNAELGDAALDQDCDGTPTADDCDDTDPTSTVVADDPDCDGVVDCPAPTATQGMDFVGLCGGAFDMGCTAAQQADGNCETRESPAHTVTLTRDFWMAETEVTQERWQALMGNNPSNFSACGADCPVDWVNWYEALAFANAVSAAEGLAECFTLAGCTNAAGDDLECASVSVSAASGSVYDCDGYRLPTEAEWEYAARAGTDSLYAGSDTVDDVAWYLDNAGSTTHPVASKAANDWGLHDLSGNVWEWTWDWYDASYYSGSPATDPDGPVTGTNRAYRGGSWALSAPNERVSYRDNGTPNYRGTSLGFRLARTVP